MYNPPVHTQPHSADDPAVAIYCPECGYDLRGQVIDRCPECGFMYDRPALLSLLASGFQDGIGLYLDAIAMLTAACVLAFPATVISVVLGYVLAVLIQRFVLRVAVMPGRDEAMVLDDGIRRGVRILCAVAVFFGATAGLYAKPLALLAMATLGIVGAGWAVAAHRRLARLARANQLRMLPRRAATILRRTVLAVWVLGAIALLLFGARLGM